MKKETSEKIKEIITKEEKRRKRNELWSIFGIEEEFNWLDFLKDVVDVFTKQDK